MVISGYTGRGCDSRHTARCFFGKPISSPACGIGSEAWSGDSRAVVERGGPAAMRRHSLPAPLRPGNRFPSLAAPPACGRWKEEMANEMRAGITASPHYPVMSLGRASVCCVPARFSFDRRSAKRCVASRAGTVRRRFGRVLFGARPHLKSPSSSCPTSAEAVVFPKRWTAFQLPDRVRFNSWELSRSVIKPSTDIVVDPVRSLQAGLATTLDVPAVRRLVVRYREALTNPSRRQPKNAENTSFNARACG